MDRMRRARGVAVEHLARIRPRVRPDSTRSSVVLPEPGFADDGDDLARPDRQRHVVERGDGAKAAGRGRRPRSSGASLIPRPPGGLARVAVVGVGADEHPPAGIVGHHLVEVAGAAAAERAGGIGADRLEGMVLEIQAAHLGIGRHGVDALLPPGAEQLQGRHAVHLRIVEGRDGRGRHQVAAADHAPGSCSWSRHGRAGRCPRRASHASGRNRPAHACACVSATRGSSRNSGSGIGTW